MAHMPVSIYIRDGPDFWNVVSFCLRQLPDMGDVGLSGHFLASSTPLKFGGERYDTGIHGTAALLGHDTTQIDMMLDALNETIKWKWPGGPIVQKYPPKLFDGFLDWFNEAYDKGAAGGAPVFVSRLLGNDTIQNEEATSHALKSAANYEGQMQIYLVGGRGTEREVASGGSTSVHPAWNTASLLLCTFPTTEGNCLLLTERSD